MDVKPPSGAFVSQEAKNSGDDQPLMWTALWQEFKGEMGWLFLAVQDLGTKADILSFFDFQDFIGRRLPKKKAGDDVSSSRKTPRGMSALICDYPLSWDAETHTPEKLDLIRI